MCILIFSNIDFQQVFWESVSVSQSQSYILSMHARSMQFVQYLHRVQLLVHLYFGKSNVLILIVILTHVVDINLSIQQHLENVCYHYTLMLLHSII